MLLASNPISSAAQPLFNAFAQVLAIFYSLIPNYAIAIALLTVAVMIVVFPITRRGTRSMMRMQIYQPEIKKLTQKFKAPPGATPAEKTALRQQQQEEMMAFYKENNISPTGGCLPMFLQLPIFWILYGTIRGLVHTTTKTLHGVKTVVADPLYIAHSSKLYHAIMAANPPGHSNIKLNSFGLNLADSVRTTGLSWAGKVPYIAMILIAVALQYVQMKQLQGRNPAARQANPQMAQMQKIFPIIFAVIYIAIPAGVNVYFIVSSLFRIGQQEFMYRRDPQLQESLRQLRERHAKAASAKQALPQLPAAPRPRGLLGRLGIANPLAEEPPADEAGQQSRGSGKAGRGSGGGTPPGGRQGSGRGGVAAAAKRGAPGAGNGQVPANGNARRPARAAAPGGKGSQPAGANKPRSQPRAEGKRARRPR